MPLLQKRHVLTLALRVNTCRKVREEGMGSASASRNICRAAQR
ncbi:hypothetical protein HMPREF0208_01072 [Citrobacter koseri]|nr:hypothetical protein HMPREF0208_01072 [Citrobacter koseri]